MQVRLGPNRVGYFGLLQPIADGIKSFLKEDIIPDNADKPVFVIAPMISSRSWRTQADTARSIYNRAKKVDERNAPRSICEAR